MTAYPFVMKFSSREFIICNFLMLAYHFKREEVLLIWQHKTMSKLSLLC